MSEAQEVTNLILGRRNDAAQTAVGSLGDDADQAARAMKLSTMTGVPAAAIEPDVENFEHEQKAAITAHILRNNSHIADYVNSHPLASKVSNDDYGQLDSVSQKLKQFGGASVVHEAMKGFAEGYGERQFGEWLYKRPQDIEFVQNHPLIGAALSVLGLPIELPAKLISGGIGAFKAGSEEAAIQAGMDPARASRMSRELGALTEWAVMQPGHILPHLPEVAAKAKPYIDAGIEPPLGIHPIVDKLKVEQSKLDLKNYDEAMRESQQSLTKERSPELFAQFVRQHTDQRIGISAEAIEKMYGEKEPTAGDGKLGFIPNIEEQFQVARETGGDIEVPLADWLAHVDPTLAKELHDDVRLRRGGVTANEAKELPAQAMVDAYHGSPHEFEAFSLDKIGTGEGAQAYGHGLYFAENRGVAQGYKDRLGGRTIEGKPVDTKNDPAHAAAEVAELFGKDLPKHMDTIRQDIKDFENSTHPAEIRSREFLKKELAVLESGKIPKFDEGNIYRVRINAEKEHFLDWDKSRAEQSDVVKEALSKLGYDEAADGFVGRDLYRLLIEHLDDKEKGATTSKAMLEAGIPGIKYLDQGSRANVLKHNAKDIAEAENTLRNIDKELQKGPNPELQMIRDATAAKLKEYEPTYNYVIFDPSIIQITHINDAAIEAIRSSADLKPLLERQGLNEVLNRYRGEFEQHGPELKVFVPEGEWTPIERQAIDAAVGELERILPGREYKTAPGRSVVLADREVKGAYQPYSDRLPTIAFLANPETAVATARHEAIHYLRRQGFFTPQEWTDLKTAAHYNNWLEKHHVAERWPDLAKAKDAATMIEEAIAEEFVDWRKAQERRTVAGKIFAKLNDLSQQVLEAIKKATGLGDKAYDIFSRIESGEIGSRTGTKPIDPRAFAGQEFEVGQQQLFAKANAIGMTVDQFKRYMKLIDKRNAEDAAWAEKKALEQTKREQSAEWKANRSRVKDEVAHDMEARPDIAAATFLQDYGLKIDRDALTTEQRDALPRSLQEKGGLPPDELASQFGFHSGDAMVERLALLDQARGRGGFKEYLEKVINAETDQRMLRQYGDLNENILAEAKDHVLSETQMDLLHEETLALGMKIGEAPLDKATLKAAFQQAFNKLRTAVIDTDKFLAEAGRAGKAAEIALLKEDPTEAFRQKQRQYYAILGANEAKALDKDMQRFEKNAKRFSKREVEGISPEYTNFVHDILMRVGQPVRRSVQDLADAIKRDGYSSLTEFVQSKEGRHLGLEDLDIIPVADFLLDPTFRKTVPELTVEEFRGLKQSIDTLIKHGRDELKILKQGESIDKNTLIGQAVERLEAFPIKAYPLNKSKMLDLPKTYMAAGTNMETLLNRWDRADSRGLFNRWFSYPLARAANHKARLDREFSKLYQELGEIKDGDKLLDSPLIDPLTRTVETPEGKSHLGFTRKNAMAILQNAGNLSNWEKLTKGYRVDPVSLRKWLFENTTKEDWDRAQRLGDIFGEINKLSDIVYHNLTGVVPEKIMIRPIETPFGTYNGWYHPVMYDPLREGSSSKLRGGDISMKGDNDYFRTSTADGYTKRRTGYVAPLDLNFDMVPIRMSQMLHNVAFREVILNTAKVFDDTKFREAVTKHYGEHYRDGLMPYLRGVAGAEGIQSKALAEATRVSELLRQNVISTYIGFNPYTALKHGPTALVLSVKEVGVVNFLSAVRDLYRSSEEIGLSNAKFAMKNSEELQRRERHWQDTILGQHKKIYGKSTIRETIIEKGSWLVAQSDMMSAKPTWLAQFRDSIRDGMDRGQAIDEADRAVRRAHGSTAITNQPALVRGGGALHGWLTSIYGFFGTMMQRRVELAHQANDIYHLGREGEIKQAAANVPRLAWGIFAYVIWPTMVEEWVTGLTTEDKRGWGTHLFNGAMAGLGSSFIYIRDITHALATGHEPGVGLISSPLHDVANLIRDVKKGKAALNKQNAGKIVGDTVTVFGDITGMAPKTIGSAARFGIDMINSQARPKTFEDWRMGLTRGTTQRYKVH